VPFFVAGQLTVEVSHNGGVDNSIAAIIKTEIERFESITFARFMELALYYPELGYYRRKAADVFGAHGDFYTAAQLQPVFGELIADFAARLQAESQSGTPFEVLELGAGRQDLRSALAQWSYRAFDWNTSSLPDRLSGLVIANEFFDAMPVHLLRRQKGGWYEVRVQVRNEEFVFHEAAEIAPALLEYARVYGKWIPEGGLLEVNPSVAEWLERISRLLDSGSVLIIDYGYEARELVRFPMGTLIGYRRHAATERLLRDPGTSDLTAHVNFTYLRDQAMKARLEVVRESSLQEWALSIWGEDDLTKRWSKADQRWRLQWKQLMFGIGGTFRVLHLRKRMPA
jgi:SAM-dependent MidA family methyltransferase